MPISGGADANLGFPDAATSEFAALWQMGQRIGLEPEAVRTALDRRFGVGGRDQPDAGDRRRNGS